MILDLGCGQRKVPGAVGIDRQALPGVDIVHDLECYPWPLEEGAAEAIYAHHIIEHLDPAHMGLVRFMDECWRVAAPGAELTISHPVAGSYEFYQDPTHCHAVNQTAWQYFDPDYPWYEMYRPRPWQLVSGPAHKEPTAAFIQVVLRKRSL